MFCQHTDFRADSLHSSCLIFINGNGLICSSMDSGHFKRCQTQETMGLAFKIGFNSGIYWFCVLIMTVLFQIAFVLI